MLMVTSAEGAVWFGGLGGGTIDGTESGTHSGQRSMMAALAQVEASAYRASVRESPAAMARWMLDNLGQRITTAGLGLKDASLVRRYARGDGAPSAEREARLRLLYRVSRMVADTYGTATAQAFLRGSNPELDDDSPLLVIATRPVEAAAGEVLGAARALLDG